MEPTLNVGESIEIQAVSGTPAIGDIVLFHPPAGADSGEGVCGDPQTGQGHQQPCDQPTPQESSQSFIKRVVAGPGDSIAIQDGHVILNGKLQREPFIRPCMPGDENCSFPKAITVPPGEWFMVGDNRGESDDSRFWGPVPTVWIVGTAVHCSFFKVFCSNA